LEHTEIGINSSFAYRSEEEYFLENCIKKVEFAKYQVSRQLESAVSRQKEHAIEVKIFAGILLALIVVCNLALAMVDSGAVVLVLIGALITILCRIVYIFVMPICLFKIIKGTIILCINKQNAIGIWAAGHFSLPLYSDEIQSCQKYLEKYRIFLEDLENCRESLENGNPFNKDFIEDQMSSIELEPQIRVVNPNYGKLHRFAVTISLIITVLLCLLVL